MDRMEIPFFVHDLGRPELDAVAEVLEGLVLTTGETVARFEQRLAAYLGCRDVVAVTSCTGALHLSLVALGIGPGDEVITTPLTFIATATAIIEAGARPVFVDVEPQTGNLAVEQVEAALTPRTRAIIPVHLYGHMCDMRALAELARRRGLHLIEDAAHCVEGMRDGVRPAQLSAAACFSFYATKSLTCGEGGAVATNDEALAARLRLLRLHGMTKTAADRAREGYTHWDMTVLGWKYNMDNIQAALLLPQMDRLEGKLEKRQRVADRYEHLLAGIPGLSWPATLPQTRHARHLFTVWVAEGGRDAVLRGLQERRIGVVVNYRPIHILTYFRQTLGYTRGSFPMAERIGDTTVSLPFYPGLPANHVEAVAEAVRELSSEADSPA